MAQMEEKYVGLFDWFCLRAGMDWVLSILQNPCGGGYALPTLPRFPAFTSLVVGAGFIPPETSDT